MHILKVVSFCSFHVKLLFTTFYDERLWLWIEGLQHLQAMCFWSTIQLVSSGAKIWHNPWVGHIFKTAQNNSTKPNTTFYQHVRLKHTVKFQSYWRNKCNNDICVKIACPKILPYTQKLFISTNFRHFRKLRYLILKVAVFTLILYMPWWNETKVAKLKIAKWPDKLKSVKLFTTAKINVSKVYRGYQKYWMCRLCTLRRTDALIKKFQGCLYVANCHSYCCRYNLNHCYAH